MVRGSKNSARKSSRESALHEGTGKSSPTISAKPVGVGAAYQPWILAHEQSGLLTHMAATKNHPLCEQMRS
jgi:hypothetical protein